MTIKAKIQVTVFLVLLVAAISFAASAVYHAYFDPEVVNTPRFPVTYADQDGTPEQGNFPYPTPFGSGPHCETPGFTDSADALESYKQWRDNMVTREGANGFRRVIAPEMTSLKPNSTVSHGIGYGMILAVYFDDRALFDDLFRYSQRWTNKHSGLMHWYVGPEGKEYCPDMVYCGSAADADQDMAFALVMADQQWGSDGEWGDIYRKHALQQIRRIREHDIDSDHVVRPGDGWGKTEFLNLSHFNPAYYEIFGRYTGDAEYWNKVVDANYRVLYDTLNEENGNVENGLVPTWSTTEGEPKPAYTSTLKDGTKVEAPTHYEFGSARTPFHIAQHYCWNGDERAKRYVDKIGGFFAHIGVENIVSGYNLDGEPHPKTTGEGAYHATLFYGTAAAAAMVNQQYWPFVEKVYNALVESDVRSSYYEQTWKTFNLMFISGNYPDLSRLDLKAADGPSGD
jgi:endo-1,4-beta-D-glucanase Y